MTANNVPYISTSLNRAYVENLRAEGTANGYKTPDDKLLSYTLMGDSLVPEAFIQKVKSYVDGAMFTFGEVIGIDDIFDPEFLESLNDSERRVLMPVILQLVARGDFGVCIWTERLTKAAAETFSKPQHS